MSSPSSDILIEAAPTAPTAPSVSIMTQPTCSTPTGSVRLNGLPSGTWTITRNPGNATSSGTGSSTILSDVPQGTYTFTVTNAAGCTSVPSTPLSINAQPQTPAAPTAFDPIYCQNATASALSATGSNLLWYTTATGGTGSFFAPTPSTATAGTTKYYVTQTANGCESPRKEINVFVLAKPNPVLVPTQPTCGLNNGSITANVTGGQTPYTYLWSNNATTATINNLSANTSTAFTVTVTDVNICRAVSTLNLTCAPLTCNNVTIRKDTSFCEGRSFTRPKGDIVYTPGLYRDTFKVGTCDSIIETNLTMKAADKKALTLSVCSSSYTLRTGRVVSASGVYADTVRGVAVNGCDSIYNYNLTLKSNTTTSLSRSICKGNSYPFNNQNLPIK